MNRWQRYTVIGIMAAALLGVLLLTAAAPGDIDYEDEINQISESLKGAIEVQLEIGAFQADNGYTTELSEEELSAFVQAYNEKVDRYYSSDNAVRESYKEHNEYLLREYYQSTLDYQVASGVLDFAVDKITTLDGNRVQVDCRAVIWGTWVDASEEGFYVIAPVNLETMSVVMVKESGEWKLDQILESNVDMDYSISDAGTEEFGTRLNSNDDDVINYDAAYTEEVRQDMLSQTYHSFADALGKAEEFVSLITE